MNKKICSILVVISLNFGFTIEWSNHEHLKEALSVLSKNNFEEEEINETIKFYDKSHLGMLTYETNLGYSDVEVQKGSPSHSLYIDSYPEPEAIEIMKDSLNAVYTSKLILYRHCNSEKYDEKYCGSMLKYIKLWNTPVSKSCNKIKRNCKIEEVYSKYRSFDGSCNNRDDGARGQSFTVYGRLLYPAYSESIENPRRSVSTKHSLRSPSDLSTNLNLEHTTVKKISLAARYWGQFIEHDLSHTAMRKMIHTKKNIECCDPSFGRKYAPRYLHNFCMPINVPFTNTYYADKGIECINYVRSIAAIGPDCALGPMQQINQATHFLDASQIYGTTLTKNHLLRNFTNSLMVVNISSFNSHSMLRDSKDSDDCPKTRAPCFSAGDKRANLNPYITALYTIWVREHNRLALNLAKMNPAWDDEAVFQEARRIVVAEIQHITYNEWIPSILGKRIDDEYDSKEDPTVSNSFATAVIRALQTIGSGTISISQKRNESQFESTGMNIDFILKKLASHYFTGERLQYIGESMNTIYGYDILSIDIQRGRDHGIPSYNEYRKFCGLNEFYSFDDLDGIIKPKILKTLRVYYSSPKDIDLIIGGLSEVPDKGVFGPTLSCIFENQFRRTRKADRYFYTNMKQPVPFSESQLKEIKKVTLARIICDNSETIEEIHPHVFKISTESNVPDYHCDSLPKLDITLWNTERYSYF